MSLYELAATLQQMVAMKESVSEDPDLAPADRDASLEAIDAEIKRYVETEIPRRGDGCAAYLREQDRRVELLDEEIKRLKLRKEAEQKRHDNLERIIIGVMETIGQKRIEGLSNTLSIQNNPPAVEIAQPELIPDDYQRVKVTMSLLEYDCLNQFFQTFEGDHAKTLLAAVSDVSKPEPMKAEIAKALKAGDGIPGARLTQSTRLVVR